MTDLPSLLLTAAVAMLPEDRREWGSAMLAELAQVRGRSERRRFALSSARASLLLPPAHGWPMVVLVGAVVVVSVVAVGPVVPGLRVFAMTFTGLVGTMAVLAVARARRLRLPAPGPTFLVAGGVAASIAATVYFLHREPTAVRHLPPAAAAGLAVMLAGCLWVAATPPRHRLGAHLGAAAGVVFACWFLLSNRLDGVDPPFPLALLLGLVLVAVPAAAFFVPAFVAARSGGSGVRAALWTVAAMAPLTFALWLPEALRRHAIDGRTLDGELTAPAAANLADALAFCLGVFPVLGLALGLIGAAAGARRSSTA